MNKKNGVLILILLFGLFIRLWQIDSVPVSLFGDELDVGYHAYSISKTGRDYMGNFLPLHFRSLAEWRTPLYLYSAVPTVALFGITPLGVRLPSVIFGILGILLMYLLTLKITGKTNLALISAFILASLPWHIHYSRAGFEVAQMLTFFLAGIYFFLLGLKNSKWLIPSVFVLALTPTIYNTAKLFLPLLLLSLITLWRHEIRLIPKRHLILVIVIFSLILIPFTYSTVFGGGKERFDGISIFNTQTLSGEIGFARERDANMRGEQVISNSITDKFFHNKINFFWGNFLNNYLESFSTQFLFTKGDPNPRHSSGLELYVIELIFLIAGLFFYLKSDLNLKVKIFFLLWLGLAPIPSALTQGGGNHATRLFLMVPSLVLLISFGIYYLGKGFGAQNRKIYTILVSGIFLLSIISFSHQYFIHYPWDSQRWWHSGFREAVTSVFHEEKKYDKVLISNADEPFLIFFLGLSMYDPEKFREEYQIFQKGENGNLKLGKFEFGIQGQGLKLYDLGANIPKGVLYLATAKEIIINLNKEPGAIPGDIKLVKTINYPSGDPAFYLFEKL